MYVDLTSNRRRANTKDLSFAYDLEDRDHGVKCHLSQKTAVSRPRDWKNTPSFSKNGVFLFFVWSPVDIGRRCNLSLMGCKYVLSHDAELHYYARFFEKFSSGPSAVTVALLRLRSFGVLSAKSWGVGGPSQIYHVGFGCTIRSVQTNPVG